MKQFFFTSTVLLTMSVATAAASAEDRREVLHCTGTLLGAPTYSVELVDPSEGPLFYRLIKQPNNPLVGPYMTEIAYGEVIRYGDAFILTQDEGRSGYALIYARGGTTVIDVNLFQQPEINSDGPLTNYQCQAN